MVRSLKRHRQSPPVFKRSIGPIITINLRWVSACLFAGLGWLMWPEDKAAWWQFAALSVMTWLCAVSLGIDALKQTIRHIERRRAMKPFEVIGSGPKGSKLAEDKALEEEGML